MGDLWEPAKFLYIGGGVGFYKEFSQEFLVIWGDWPDQEQ